MKNHPNVTSLVTILLLISVFLAMPQTVFAHCDTVDGPVVMDAKTALDKSDITPVLKWIKPAKEAEIRQAFEQTMKVRNLNDDAKKLADYYFFETVVRVHREGEGAPYTGLKAADSEVDPGIAAADKSLTSGKVAPVVDMVNDDIGKGINERFEKTMNLKQHMNESVDQGREYVEAYVEYIHYVERLINDASGKSSERASGTPAEEHH
ncbi:MAG: DUF6448 family protein [Armatimonadota bacterium]